MDSAIEWDWLLFSLLLDAALRLKSLACYERNPPLVRIRKQLYLSFHQEELSSKYNPFVLG